MSVDCPTSRFSISCADRLAVQRGRAGIRGWILRRAGVSIPVGSFREPARSGGSECDLAIARRSVRGTMDDADSNIRRVRRDRRWLQAARRTRISVQHPIVSSLDILARPDQAGGSEEMSAWASSSYHLQRGCRPAPASANARAEIFRPFQRRPTPPPRRAAVESPSSGKGVVRWTTLSIGSPPITTPATLARAPNSAQWERPAACPRQKVRKRPDSPSHKPRAVAAYPRT